jgi:integrase
MKGCRPLKPDEETLIARSLSGSYAARDRAIFILGTKSGFRISELLSLKIGDIVQAGRIVDRVYVRRCNIKRKIEGRSVILHPDAKKALNQWLKQLRQTGFDSDDFYLFRSRKGGNRSISRIQFYKILRAAFRQNDLAGKLGTHTMRKTFANKVFDRLGHDIFKTAKALGHKNINSTVEYLSFRQEEIDEAILKA